MRRKPDGQMGRNGTGPPAMCDAAIPRLREARTNQIVLTMAVDARGKVQSFTTDAPKGLRLEKNKKAVAEIQAMASTVGSSRNRQCPIEQPTSLQVGTSQVIW
jgi:hypothetical protein